MDLYNASMGEEIADEIELTVEQYQEAQEHYQGIIDRANSARRLASNEDFKSLVMEGYFQNEPNRLADLMASGRLAGSAFEGCVQELKSIGNFRNYLKMHIEQGHFAEIEMAALEEARDEAIKNEAGE